MQGFTRTELRGPAVVCFNEVLFQNVIIGFVHTLAVKMSDMFF